ncbi:hypothetical protein CP532_4107 [Ophiocordyceps camponoti-leonardi (nom. inval.)]|nr:hypothetical protein CP532_4107 [Ophiocordyceps camponoti-leonardi (nom. inval.)]
MRPPLVRIVNGTFYNHRSSAPVLTKLTFELPSTTPSNWCVVGPSRSGKSSFLQVLAGSLQCDPPGARSYPYLTARRRSPLDAMRYVGFGSGRDGSLADASNTYVSARYESKRDAADFCLRDYLQGRTQVNVDEKRRSPAEPSSVVVEKTAVDFGLGRFLDSPVVFLSNGQTRRARIARALLTRPEVLLLDEPFMGLDPETAREMASLFARLVAKGDTRLVMCARPQDPLPGWITHLVYLGDGGRVVGSKQDVFSELEGQLRGDDAGTEAIGENQKWHIRAFLKESRRTGQASSSSSSSSAYTGTAIPPTPVDADAEPVVEMDGCQVRYGDKIALGDWTQKTKRGDKAGMVWTVRRGERWGVFGPNGSGKTTMVSLLSAEHPQVYSLPIRLFGRGFLAEPGSDAPRLDYWTVQEAVSVSSPEADRLVSRSWESVRAVVEGGFYGLQHGQRRRRLTDTQKGRVVAALRLFAPELWPGSDGLDVRWADERAMRDLSLSAQRVILFLRRILKGPRLLILDETFSGMDAAVRDKCMRFLAHGQGGKEEEEESFPGLTAGQTLICISHLKEEVPDLVRDWEGL